MILLYDFDILDALRSVFLCPDTFSVKTLFLISNQLCLNAIPLGSIRPLVTREKRSVLASLFSSEEDVDCDKVFSRLNLCSPPLDTLEQFYILHMLQCPKQHTVMEVRLHQRTAEWSNPFPCLIGSAVPDQLWLIILTARAQC